MRQCTTKHNILFSLFPVFHLKIERNFWTGARGLIFIWVKLGYEASPDTSRSTIRKTSFVREEGHNRIRIEEMVPQKWGDYSPKVTLEGDWRRQIFRTSVWGIFQHHLNTLGLLSPRLKNFSSSIGNSSKFLNFWFFADQKENIWNIRLKFSDICKQFVSIRMMYSSLNRNRV